MKPMLGDWVVDLDATLLENARLPDAVLAAIKRDLTQFPFELTITDHEYVSRSRVKTNADHYTVLEADGESVTIALSSADGAAAARGRTTRLRNRQGKLLIKGRGPVTVVMSRAARND